MTDTTGRSRDSFRLQFRPRALDSEQVTARYRAAKKRQSSEAMRVGALRSEIANLHSRVRQMERGGRDASAILAALDRTEVKLATAVADLAAAANDYRVAHVELLMTPAAQGHYVDAIGKQQLLANLSEDGNEIAVLAAMRNTLALVLALAAQRRAAESTGREARTAVLEEMNAPAASAETGVFRSHEGRVYEIRGDNGTITTSLGPLGPLPYDYTPGMAFGAGHLLLREAVRLGKQVDPGDPTGYAGARSVIL